MLLGDGILTVYEERDVSGPGEKPRYEKAERTRSYYAELSFDTRPVNPTGSRSEQRVDARVRIRQCREIREDDVALMESFHKRTPEKREFRIVRAFHGTDEESGLAISDLSLEEVGKT